MKKYFNAFALLLLLTVSGCYKETTQSQVQPVNQQAPSTVLNQPSSVPADKFILVDASKDGGTWWFPQSPETGFSAKDDHQGKQMADYLRSLGFQVDELPRGAVITSELLDKYSKIIRAAPFFAYTDEEIKAYDKFLTKPGAIMLLQDHLIYDPNDKLSEHLGIIFDGAVSGTITKFAADSITNNAGSLNYIAGSVVINAAQNPNIVVLGSLSKDTYTVLNNNSLFAGMPHVDAPVMGILKTYPLTKIFFLGDVNGMEGLPQPFTQNLVQWLFE